MAMIKMISRMMINKIFKSKKSKAPGEEGGETESPWAIAITRILIFYSRVESSTFIYSLPILTDQIFFKKRQAYIDSLVLFSRWTQKIDPYLFPKGFYKSPKTYPLHNSK
jgi:hypothetical protein